MRWLDPAFASIWTNCICMDYKHICHFVLILWTFVCLVFYFYRISQTSALWRWNPEFASFRTWVHFSYFTIWMNLELHLHYICICVWFLHRSKWWCITFRKCFLVAFFCRPPPLHWLHLYRQFIYLGQEYFPERSLLTLAERIFIASPPTWKKLLWQPISHLLHTVLNKSLFDAVSWPILR